MGIFQPLYYSGGRYSSYTDRKLLTALIDSNSSGVRVEGVIPSAIGTNAMLVEYSSPNTITVNPGMAVIADSVASSASSGLYLAGIDGADETATFETATSSRTDRVYAVINTTGYAITNKTLGNTTGGASATNTAKLTTSEPHGFKVNQTVVVSGVDDTFDGTHTITAIPSTTTFEYAKTASDVVSVAVTPALYYGTTSYVVSNKALSAAGLATLTMSTTASFTAGQLITVKGVDATFDGTYAVATTTSSSSTVTYYINKPNSAVTSVAVGSTSAVAQARVPFFIGVEPSTGTSPGGVAAGTYSNNYPSILLAELSIPAGSAVATVTDKRTFTTARGGVHLYTSATPSAPADTPGRFRYNVTTNTLEYYTTTWKSFVELADDTSSTKAARGNHAHSGYALSGHNHDTVYADVSHTHLISQIENWEAVGYTAPAAPVSKGYSTYQNATNVTSTSFVDISPAVSQSLTLSGDATGAYVLVTFSAELDNSTSAYVGMVSVAVTGSATISAEPAASSSSHGMAATDGTAFNAGDFASVYGTSKGSGIGHRIFKLPNGTYNFKLQAKTFERDTGNGGGTLTISNPSLNIIPIRVY